MRNRGRKTNKPKAWVMNLSSLISNKEIPLTNPIPILRKQPELIPLKEFSLLDSGNIGPISNKDIEQPKDTLEVPADDIKPERGQQNIDSDTIALFPPALAGKEITLKKNALLLRLANSKLQIFLLVRRKLPYRVLLFSDIHLTCRFITPFMNFFPVSSL